MSVVTEYIAQLEPADRSVFTTLRTIVHQLIPDIEETLSYGQPAYKYKGKYLLAFGRTKTYLSLYPGADVIAAFKDQLKDYVYRKGTIHFTAEYPLPQELMHAIVTYLKTTIDKS
jgi:uncharacterized protein YdhG (YjbR/CyaY superfamily)